ncbi:MAG: adenosine kinase [Oligoflexia bacterium]|nr:adenosine kinase [Oligoflexia bacterium]MBF0365590.1 adenosine kinase [Oligoflexia bacterium]
MKNVKVLGLGHLVVDKCVNVTTSELATWGLQSEARTKIDSEYAQYIKTVFPERITKTVGGSIGNTIRLLAALDISTSLISAIGDDNDSIWLREKINELSIDDHLNGHAGATGECFVFALENGEKTMLFNPGVSHKLSKESIQADFFNHCKYFYSTAYMLQTDSQQEALMQSIEMARTNKSIIGLDLADKDVAYKYQDQIKALLYSGKINHLFANRLEVVALLGNSYESQVFDLLKKNSIDYFLIKDGANGSTIYSREAHLKIESKIVKVVDGTGAGDAYAAGFILAFLAGKSTDLIGKIATECAGCVIQSHGVCFTKEDVSMVKNYLREDCDL